MDIQHTFKGLSDWVEIFKGGLQKDSKGRALTFTESDLDDIVASVSAANPVPHRITHKKLFSPFAYAQSHEAKRDGNSVLVRSRNIEPQFEKLLQDGRLYERSVGIRRDESTGKYKLDHIAWLGAEPPAVEGLAPVEFNQGGELFEFTNAPDWYVPSRLARMMRNMREFIVDKFSVEEADRVIPDYEIESLTDHINAIQSSESGNSFQQMLGDHPVIANPDQNASISQPSVQPAGEQSGAQGKNSGGEQNMNEFTQADIDAAVQAEKDKNNELQTSLATERRQRLSNEFQAVVDDAIDAGRLTPAQSEGMVEFMLQLQESDSEFEYSSGEGDGAKAVKAQPVSWFQQFLGTLGEQVDMTESDAGTDFTPGESRFSAPAGTTVDPERAALHAKALDYQAQHQGIDYTSAVKAVSNGDQ